MQQNAIIHKQGKNKRSTNEQIRKDKSTPKQKDSMPKWKKQITKNCNEMQSIQFDK